MRQSTLLAVGTVFAALGASMCCILPVAVALLGVGSAAAGATLEPARPYFILLTSLLIGFALYKSYRKERACAPGGSCEASAIQKRNRALIWGAALVALSILLFPYYIGLLV